MRSAAVRSLALLLVVLAACSSQRPAAAPVSVSPTPSPSPATPSPSPMPGPSSSPTPAPPLAVSRAACGPATGRVVTWRVLVEKGLATTPERFASDVRAILCDPRSWIASGDVRFRYDPKGRILMGLRHESSSSTRCVTLMGKRGGYYSCAGVREIAFNASRWFGGSRYWPGPLGEYRRMLVNHEVGHILGQGHRTCPRAGAAAPVMQQQSKGLKGCVANVWPLASELRTL